MSWQEALKESWFGQFLRGLMKLALAGVIVALLNALNLPSTVSVAGQNIDLSIVVLVIKVFAPLLLVISALHDMGVRI